MFIKFLSIIPLLFCYSAFGAECSFESHPQIIEDVESPRVFLIMWEEPTHRALSSYKLPNTETFHNYQNSVQEVISIEPYFLLRRYIPHSNRPEDVHNIHAVISGIGEIRAISCVEALLIDFQIQRTPNMLVAPTEFLAYFLTKQDRLRIYLLTNDSLGVGRMNRLMSEISQSLQSGWKVVGNLHNHSFFLEDLESDKPQGVLAPSGNDLQAFRGHTHSFGPLNASVTNGFHTISIDSELFKFFKGSE